MQEISGIQLFPDEHNIYAINDEQGKIFVIDLNTNKPYPTSKFDRSGDYEDLVHTPKGWIVLKSNGTLYLVHDILTDSVTSTEYPFLKGGKQEFESIYPDAASNSLMIVCKQCEEDKGQRATSVYRFNLGTMQYDTVPAYRIDVKEIAKAADSDMKNFRPSAAAVHPIEKRVYMVDAINNLLVITDMSGKVQEAHHLKGRLYEQPEGISFAPNGDMYISNEAGDGIADILKFAYKP
jgi:DNA-binding beta-propeller fold protein YncE